MAITTDGLKVSITERYDQEFMTNGQFVAFHCIKNKYDDKYIITQGNDKINIFGIENLKAFIEFLQNVVKA